MGGQAKVFQKRVTGAIGVVEADARGCGCDPLLLFAFVVFSIAEIIDNTAVCIVDAAWAAAGSGDFVR